MAAWRRQSAERRAGQGHTRPTRAARLSAGVIKCPPFAPRSSGHGVKGSADFSPQRVVGGMEFGRTCDVPGEAECCGLKVRAPQSCGAAMSSVVIKVACSSGGSGRTPTRPQQSVSTAAIKKASDTNSNKAIQRTQRLIPTSVYPHKRRMTRPPKNESCLRLLRGYTASR